MIGPVGYATIDEHIEAYRRLAEQEYSLQRLLVRVGRRLRSLAIESELTAEIEHAVNEECEPNMIYLLITWGDGYEPVASVGKTLCHRAMHKTLEAAEADAKTNHRDGGIIFEIDPENLKIEPVRNF